MSEVSTYGNDFLDWWVLIKLGKEIQAMSKFGKLFCSKAYSGPLEKFSIGAGGLTYFLTYFLKLIFKIDIIEALEEDSGDSVDLSAEFEDDINTMECLNDQEDEEDDDGGSR